MFLPAFYRQNHTVSSFIDSIVRDFSSTPVSDMDDIIPPWLFDDRQVLTVRLPFCPKNEEISKTFIHKLEEYTKGRFTYKIIWNTRTIRSLFPLKDRVEHRCCVIYEGTCTCGEKYTGETNRNTEVRWRSTTTPPMMALIHPNISTRIQPTRLHGK